MERQAAYDLFKCFLQKRNLQGMDLAKELSGLLTFGVTKGCFADPNSVFEFNEWRNYGDILWEAVLNDDKTAKKLAKPWRAVANALKQHQAEQKAVQAAAARLGSPVAAEAEASSPYPLPPATNTVYLPPETVPPTATSALPTASPLDGSGDRPGTGAEDLGDPEAVRVAMERRKVWRTIAGEAIAAGDRTAADALLEVACPVVFTPAAGGRDASDDNAVPKFGVTIAVSAATALQPAREREADGSAPGAAAQRRR